MNSTPHPTEAGWQPGEIAAINSTDVNLAESVDEVVEALTVDPSLANVVVIEDTPPAARGMNTPIVHLDELPFYAKEDTAKNAALADQVEQLLIADGELSADTPAVMLDDSLPTEGDSEALPPLTDEQKAALEAALALRGKSTGVNGVLAYLKALEATGAELTVEQQSLYSQLKKMQKVYPQVHGRHVHLKKRQSKSRKKR